MPKIIDLNDGYVLPVAIQQRINARHHMRCNVNRFDYRRARHRVVKRDRGRASSPSRVDANTALIRKALIVHMLKQVRPDQDDIPVGSTFVTCTDDYRDDNGTHYITFKFRRPNAKRSHRAMLAWQHGRDGDVWLKRLYKKRQSPMATDRIPVFKAMKAAMREAKML